MGTLTRGIQAATLLSNARTELQDSGAAPRWPDSQLLVYLNDAFRDLSRADCFKRTDVLVPTATRSSYQTLVECSKVFAVWYDGRRLCAADPLTVEKLYGQGWRTQASGEVSYYIPGDVLEIIPAPASAGTTPSFGTAPISEADGKGPGGNGYWAALNSSTIQHWIPGDGTVTNGQAGGNLWVEYSYITGTLTSTMYVPLIYELCVREYIVAMCLEKSDDAAEVKLRDRAMERYLYEKGKFSTGVRWTADLLPSFPSDGIWRQNGPYNVWNP